jgi:hypothetical protein
VWAIVASLVFTGATVRWLSFAEGLGFVLLAVGGLTLNQVRYGRVARTPLRVTDSVGEASDSSRPTAMAA